jgi:hypothetical protein
MRPLTAGMSRVMDELQRSIYVDRFRLAFHTLQGTAFQDWFVRLAGHAFGTDFEEVRPYGPQGDLKCDGRRISTKSVFQCYAPYLMKDVVLIAKVNEDFHGARADWAAEMAEWIFVHNDGRGLPPKAVQHIDDLRTAHAPIGVETWSEPELLKLSMALDLPALQALFGYAPSIAIVDRLVMADLVPIIDALQRQEPNPNDPPLTPSRRLVVWPAAGVRRRDRALSAVLPLALLLFRPASAKRRIPAAYATFLHAADLGSAGAIIPARLTTPQPAEAHSEPQHLEGRADSRICGGCALPASGCRRGLIPGVPNPQ